MARRPVIYLSNILAWADAFREGRGRWPRSTDGIIEGGPGLTWCAVDQALFKGHRGLVGGQSLAKLLLAHRRKRHRTYLAPLTISQILSWADQHRQRTGEWPLDNSGPIHDAPSETWRAVHSALRNGHRGLPGGASLAQLLHSMRGVGNQLTLPRLTEEQILEWADAHRTRTGRWPKNSSGAILHAPGERWHAVNAALIAGNRGLAGGSSLARLLAEKRGVRNQAALPPLLVERIREWAVAYFRRTGDWPRKNSGEIPESPGDTWFKAAQALDRGLRGLPGRSTLYRTLAPCREEHGVVVASC